MTMDKSWSDLSVSLGPYLDYILDMTVSMISYLLCDANVISLSRRNWLCRLLEEEMEWEMDLERVAVTKNCKSVVEWPRLPMVMGYFMTAS